MKNIYLIIFLTMCYSIVVGQEQQKDSTNYNPLTKFIGTWEADYIRTIDGEEKVFRIYYQGKPSITGKGVRVVFYSTLDTILKDAWMEGVYYYNDEDNKIYSLGISSSNSVHSCPKRFDIGITQPVDQLIS